MASDCRACSLLWTGAAEVDSASGGLGHPLVLGALLRVLLRYDRVTVLQFKVQVLYVRTVLTHLFWVLHTIPRDSCVAPPRGLSLIEEL